MAWPLTAKPWFGGPAGSRRTVPGVIQPGRLLKPGSAPSGKGVRATFINIASVL
jgi:hypothetical protein